MMEQSSNTANPADSLARKVNRMIAGGSLDYNSWRSLILEIEVACPENMDTISIAYDSFLLTFPLCHWHLEKYAYHKAKLCGTREAIKVYERGASVAMFSVGFWVDYFTFCTSCSKDPEDVRRLFARALSFVEKDYYCHALWDKYMKYEFNLEGWSFLALSYVKALKFPTKKLQFYYDNFKQFVANLEEEVGIEKRDMEVDQISGPCAAPGSSKDEISLIIKDLLNSSDRSIKSKALDRYRAIGEKFYEESCQMEEKIKCFEKKIVRQYFYTTPLADDQLNNWHLYLDFIEKLDNLDWAVKLYERCLIPCANHPEFWMRYVEFLESKGGRELAISALDRAAQIFLKDVPEIHLFSARYKEHIGDADGARATLLLFDAKTDSSFIEKTMALANLERRLGNFAAASATCENAVETAKEKQRLHILPILFIHFAQLTFLISGSAAARDVLIEGVHLVPCCRFLLEELIKFAMTHGGASHLNVIDDIIARVISPGSDEQEDLNAKDCESISCLFLEYVNLCGTIHDLRKAWNRHVKLFPLSLRIRMRTTYDKQTSVSYLTDGVRAEKENNESSGQDRPSGSNHVQLQGQEQILKSTVVETHPNKALERALPLQEMPTEALSKQDGFHNDEPDYELSRQCREDNLGCIVLSAELIDHAKENASNLNEPGHDPTCQSTGDDERGHMDVCTELAKPSEENALILDKRAQEADNSSETTKSDHPDLNHECRQEKHLVSLDNSLNSKDNETQESIPEPVDKNESRRCMAGESTPSSILNSDFNSFAGSKSIETEHVHHELERERPVSAQIGTLTKKHAGADQPYNTGNAIEADNCVALSAQPAPSEFQEQAPDQESKFEQSSNHDCHPANASDAKMHINLEKADQNSDKQEPDKIQFGATHEDKEIVKDQHASHMTSPTNVSSGHTPTSSQPVSYPMPNVNQIASQNNQDPWHTQVSLTMNQMLQYHYQQQQLLQQQYQQQQYQAYYQLQQNYQQFCHQVQPQQQVQLMNQQQQQLQSSPYQAYQMQQQMSTYQQPGQQFNQQHYQQNQHQAVGHLQVHQAQETPMNFQQTHAQQPQQPQDPTYQAHQLAYQQHASQAQQLLLQQYQQYQAYQQTQQQQQSQEGPNHTLEQHLPQHPVQNQQNESLQQHPHVISTNLTQQMGQNQQGSRSSSAPPDSAGAAKPSESPHLSI